MISVRAKLAAAALFATTLMTAGLVAAPATGSPVLRTVSAHHACTRTSSGKCIRAGEFCPKAKYGHSGYDARGRRYVCKGSRSHPHWERP